MLVSLVLIHSCLVIKKIIPRSSGKCLGTRWRCPPVFGAEYRLVRSPLVYMGQTTERAPYRMLCARVINGIGTGCLNAIVPVWSAEVATHTSRGAFIASEFTLNIFGVVCAYWIEFGLGFVADGNTQVRWRVSSLFLSGSDIICSRRYQFPIAFQIIPVLAFMVSDMLNRSPVITNAVYTLGLDPDDARCVLLVYCGDNNFH